MHLWSTAAQQVNECRVERHYSISQMHPVFFLLLTTKPVITEKKNLRDRDKCKVRDLQTEAQSTDTALQQCVPIGVAYYVT